MQKPGSYEFKTNVGDRKRPSVNTSLPKQIKGCKQGNLELSVPHR